MASKTYKEPVVVVRRVSARYDQDNSVSLVLRIGADVRAKGWKMPMRDVYPKGALFRFRSGSIEISADVLWPDESASPLFEGIPDVPYNHGVVEVSGDVRLSIEVRPIGGSSEWETYDRTVVSPGSNLQSLLVTGLKQLGVRKKADHDLAVSQMMRQLAEFQRA